MGTTTLKSFSFTGSQPDTRCRTWRYVYQDIFHKGYIPKDWTDSFLKPIHKLGKDNHKLNGYRILTMESIVAS